MEGFIDPEIRAAEDDIRAFLGVRWQDLPHGAQGHNFNPETLRCPVCDTRVRLVERVDCGESRDELRIFICPKCNTVYSRSFPRDWQDSQPLESTDPQKDRLQLLEQRLAQQERLITHLIDEVARLTARLESQSPPPARPSEVGDYHYDEQEQEQEQEHGAENLARKYHHLL